MAILFQIGSNAIASYKRLAYTPWHAIAELVDNSTQSYFNNREVLDAIADAGQPPLTVTVDYDLNQGVLRVEDNAMGMSYEELQRAICVAVPPDITSGRSKYGMGLKTAACWLGNLWTVRTKKLGETVEHTITVDVEQVSKGNNDLLYQAKKGAAKESHYTVVEIKRHNREFRGRTLGKIRQFLQSMYREDFRENLLTLIWQSKVLAWAELDDRLLKARDGKIHKKDFEFEIDTDCPDAKKHVRGWVGILGTGSRSDAGFSILYSGRVIKGWPDSWRPASLYGQEQGSNDLVNQRLVGEIHLDDFEVSHTKDDILWLGAQEEEVEAKLLKHCSDFREVARAYRKGKDARRGPSSVVISTAITELRKELKSPELADLVALDPMLPEELVKQVVKSIKESVVGKYQEKYLATIANLTVKGYVEEDMSPNDPYVTIDSTQESEVLIIVNATHPHWKQLNDALGVLNYLRHCTYDGIAEWQARQKTARIDPETIKLLKDKLLRLPLELEKHAELEDSDFTEPLTEFV